MVADKAKVVVKDRIEDNIDTITSGRRLHLLHALLHQRCLCADWIADQCLDHVWGILLFPV